jgi:small-conductance mechanosensitive channel
MPTMVGMCCGIAVADNIMDLPDIVKPHMQMIFYNVLTFTITLFIAHLISAFLQYKLSNSNLRNGSTSILATVINVGVYAIGIILILDAHGISISPLLTALGVGGLASALALQDTLSNLFSGITTLVSKQIRIGDYIKLSTGASGRVTDMNWRNTTLRTSTGNMIIVPNKSIAASTLMNYEQPLAECTITIPLTITYGSNLEQVESVTLETARHILANSQYGVTGFEPAVRYKELGEYGIAFDVVLRIKNVVDEGILKHQFIKAIYQAYQDAEIKLLERTP